MRPRRKAPSAGVPARQAPLWRTWRQEGLAQGHHLVKGALGARCRHEAAAEVDGGGHVGARRADRICHRLGHVVHALAKARRGRKRGQCRELRLRVPQAGAQAGGACHCRRAAAVQDGQQEIIAQGQEACRGRGGRDLSGGGGGRGWSGRAAVKPRLWAWVLFTWRCCHGVGRAAGRAGSEWGARVVGGRRGRLWLWLWGQPQQRPDALGQARCPVQNPG